MAVIVRNSFLDIAEGEHVSTRRCQSVPRSWKLPVPVDISRDTPLAMASPDSSARALLLSDFSFFSPATSCEDNSFQDEEHFEPSFKVPLRSHCRTPSTMSSASTSYLCESSDCDASSVSSPCEISAAESQSEQQDTEPLVCTQCALEVEERTPLKINAPAFESVRSETREDAIVNAVHLALKTCGRANCIKIDRCADGRSSTLITAEVSSGAHTYEVLHLAKGALEAVTARLQTVALLSGRVQKEDTGYSLRSSIGYAPKEAENRLCWDLFQRGCCPRRHQCRWYHPESSDIGKVKISIRYAQEARSVSSEQPSVSGSSAGKLTISLGDLL